MKITVCSQNYEFPIGASALDIATTISKELRRTTLVARINGRLISLPEPIREDGVLEFLDGAQPDALRTLRHTASHVLAQAVRSLRPDVKLAIGPATDNGFYYDFDSAEPFTPEFLELVEKEMQRIIKKNSCVERFELPRQEALELMRDEPYKAELINALPHGATISFYRQEGFTDLCAGPHLPSTGMIKAFRLTSVAGAYWRGDEKNKMLQRIYGVAFTSKDELAEYLRRMEEAKKRDHRRLGRQLDLFDVFDEGPGFPFFFPKGMVLRNTLEDYGREIHRKNGYEEIKTPIMLNRGLWEQSGHWDHYRESMYTTEIDDVSFGIKPMNCPGGMLVYKRRPVSYRDLPIRCGELGLVHRHELSGTLHGLMCVRCFTQDDAHIFMTPEQIRDEIKGVYRLIDEVYNVFGFQYHVELSTRPENSIGTDEMWELATNGLRGALDDLGVNYVVNEGDGAFYGPKIDFHLQDCIGRTWQCGTIQLDMNLPERFDLTYTGADGHKHRPVMIHRVVFGSIERFIGILTEHFAGAFPLWLAPVQAKVMTVTDRADEYARSVQAQLESAGVRTELDSRNEKIGFKIREAQLMKIPYMLILGDREVESGMVSVRARSGEPMEAIAPEALISRLSAEIKSRAK